MLSGARHVASFVERGRPLGDRALISGKLNSTGWGGAFGSKVKASGLARSVSVKSWSSGTVIVASRSKTWTFSSLDGRLAVTFWAGAAGAGATDAEVSAGTTAGTASAPGGLDGADDAPFGPIHLAFIAASDCVPSKGRVMSAGRSASIASARPRNSVSNIVKATKMRRKSPPLSRMSVW